jgi:endogenous inhibitor of DNA gyrase (YacG/DUF329 family)
MIVHCPYCGRFMTWESHTPDLAFCKECLVFTDWRGNVQLVV